MTINLSIFPLEDISKLNVPQKCILPFEIITANAYNYGVWVRCALQTAENIGNDGKFGYVICQVYRQTSREPKGSEVAYIDRTVTVGVNQQDYTKRLQGATLNHLELLNEVTIEEVDLTFIISKNFLTKASKINLVDIAKLYLQVYCLTNRCTVRSQNFERFGIVAIDVNASKLNDECVCYRITDETLIRIANVKLQTVVFPLKVFHTVAHEIVLEELHEMIIGRHNRDCCLVNSNALIVGPVGCGKDATIEYFVQQYNCNYLHVSLGNILGQYPGETEMKMREIFDAARTFVTCFKPKAPMIIHLEDLHLICPTINAGSKDSGNSLRLCAQLNSLMDSLHFSRMNIFCLATTTDAKLMHKSLLCPGRFHNEIHIDPPNDVQRKIIFQRFFNERLPQHFLTEEILENVAAQTSGYVIADLITIVRSIEQTLLHKESQELTKIIAGTLAKSKPASIRGNDVTVIKSELTFNDIGGMQDLKDTLQLNVLMGLTRAKAYKRFGLSLPKGVLLYGPPGCAKTTIAKCLAAEARMTFISTSGAEIYSPYVGCAEKFIVKLFDTARKHAPCLLFLDEIDTLVGCRTLGSNANDIQMRILSTLLTEMDGIVHTRNASEAYILVVAATNRPQMIDNALLRPGRFDQLIHVPAPDRDSRHSILKLYRQRMPFAENCNLLEIAERTHNFSGADICNLCNEVALHALRRDMNAIEITKDDFESVLQKQKSSLSQSQIDAYYQFKNNNIKS